jgi:hypothetical protein
MERRMGDNQGSETIINFMQVICKNCGKPLKGVHSYCFDCACPSFYEASIFPRTEHLKGSEIHCSRCQEYQSKQKYPWGGNTPIVPDEELDTDMCLQPGYLAKHKQGSRSDDCAQCKKFNESLQINPETLKQGLKSDVGKSRIGLIPPTELLELGDLFGLGANKYCDYNWTLGMDFHRLYDAMMRHALKWWAGEENDSVDGQTHLVSVAFGALCLLHYMNNYEKYSKFDDRPHLQTPEKIIERQKAKTNG